MMMRAVFSLAAVALLAACGETKPPPSAEHVAFTEACTAGGGDPAMCECRAGKIDALVAAADVSPEVQQAFLLQEQGKEEEADAIMQGLPPNVLFEQPSRIAEAQLECHQPS